MGWAQGVFVLRGESPSCLPRHHRSKSNTDAAWTVEVSQSERVEKGGPGRENSKWEGQEVRMCVHFGEA